MSDARAELELACRVVAMCKIAAEERTGKPIPFSRIWNDIKGAPLGVVFSQAKDLIDADPSLDDLARARVYLSLGRFFGGILRYGRSKGVTLKIRNGT